MARLGRAALALTLALGSTAVAAQEAASQFVVEGRAASLRIGGRVHLQARHDSQPEL